MKSGFKNKLEPKYEKEPRNPWTFDCPSYDNRSSCAISAGTQYGVGHKQPVGNEKVTHEYAVPLGKVDTLKTAYVHKGPVDVFEIEK